ncbi:hypothetical protein EJB05_27511, partial [Eragrostis curvula]
MPSVTKDRGADNLSGEAEHSGVRRLRHRRLLAFLRLQGLEGTFRSLVQETNDCFFSAVHLRQFVQQGRWRDAIGYLSRFLPADVLNDGQTTSIEAEVLHGFLVAHKYLDEAGHDAGGFATAAFANYRSRDFKSLSHGAVKIRYMMFIAFHAKHQHKVRPPLNWDLVRNKASHIIYDLVYKTPELKSVVQLPAGPIKPHTVLPIRLISSRRSQYHRKKQSHRPSPSALANCYIRKRSLLASSHSQEPRHEPISKAFSWTADLIDESLKAGEQMEHRQEHPLQTGTRKEGATSAPVSHAKFGTLTEPARNHGMPSVANAGESTTRIPSSRNMFGAPVSQTVVSSLTFSGTSMMANAGITKISSQDGSNADSTHQDFNPMENHPKRQRTTGPLL